MRRRVTVVVLCVCVCVSVCLSVTTKSAAYLVFTSQTKFYRVLYGVINVFTVWLSLKTLHSIVLASFAGHRCLPRSLANFRRPNETAMTSFQLEKYRVYVGIVRQLVLWDIHINEDGSFWFGGHCIIPN